jgi:hypothetical protein
MRKPAKTITKIIILLIIFTILSCKKSAEIEELKVPKIEERINENLIYFDFGLISDVNIEDENNSNLYEVNDLKIKYIDDIIYIKGFLNANACDDFNGNIEYKDKNLKLKMINLSPEPCMSLSKYEVRFIIKNIERKKYKITFDIKY